MQKKIYLTLIRLSASFCYLICFSTIVFSQANDNCSNPYQFIIPNNGYGTGVINSGPILISNATVETGETFAPAIFVAGQDRKSLWYKFTLPTKRAIRVTLDQSGNSILAGDVGFAVYKSDTCLPPISAISTKLTPIDIFGNTYHPCVEPGTYLIQVSGRQNTAGQVVVELSVEVPFSSYDEPSGAYDFGVLQPGISKVSYNVTCLSLQNINETCNGLSGHYKTSWHVFTTPLYFDYLAFMIAARFPGGNRAFGYRLYSGDVRTISYASLPVIEGCDSLFLYDDVAYVRTYKCEELNRNAVYSVQLFFEESSEDSVSVGIMTGGTGPTSAPQPILGQIPTGNQFGTLAVSNSGALTSRSDVLACNSRHSLHPCLPAMPDSAGINGLTLSTFFTLSVPQKSNLFIESLPVQCDQFPLLLRIFKATPGQDCSNLRDSNQVDQFYRKGQINCIDSGDYIIQVLGNEREILNPLYRFGDIINSPSHGCLFSNLGSAFQLNITATNADSLNRFSLNSPGSFDPVNTLLPLVNGVQYQTRIDTFGCAPTVLPFDTICPATSVYDRAIYRQFVVTDSGVAGIYFTGFNIVNKIYRGDANSLASAQNAFSFPDSIRGLLPVSGCMTDNGNLGNRACVTPGTYTTVEWGTSDMVGPVWNYQNPVLPYQSTIIFTKDSANDNSPSNPEDMGDILSQLPPTGGTVTSSVIYFTCFETADTIQCSGGGGGGLIPYPPCLINGVRANKAIYREFYLSREATIDIFSTLITPAGFQTTGYMTLFSGRISNPQPALSVVPGFDCNGGSCKRLPAGWYTTISYGVGPNYQTLSGFPSNNFVGMGEFITINVCPGSRFNRPYKAAVDTTTNQPFLIEWGPNPGHTSTNPNTARYYTLYSENFGCSNDTPFSAHPINPCGTGSTKVTYHVFRLTQESYLKIYTYMETPSGNIPMWSALYNKDIRSDSALFPGLQPVQPCIQSDSLIIICRAQPGVYTLAVFYQADNRCLLFTPKIWIDQTGLSRFDHASKAYDFGSVNPDSTFYFGKQGDPYINGRAPSNDIFYCTTCSRPTDPTEDSCYTFYSPRVNDAINNFLFPDSAYPNFQAGSREIPRRNLWYTFVIKGGGTVRVKVNNQTQQAQEPSRFSIYSSDIDANISFANAVANGQVDSTYIQGLTYVTSNKPDQYSCSSTGNEAEFYKDPCNDERYYILVTNKNELNNQIEVGVLFDSVAAIPQGDYCSNAVPLILNGPSSNSSMANVTCHTIGTDYGEFYSTLTCPPGANTSDFKTTWFKITITGVDTMDLRTFITNFTTADATAIRYRLMSGNCGAMQERSCVQDARTVDTYKCLPPGDYFLQVFTPVFANGRRVRGDIELHASVVPHADPCVPTTICLANARFIPRFDCLSGDSATFQNFSTYGYDIRYSWSSGFNNQTSSSLSPSFYYPPTADDRTYMVRLITRNVACGGADTALLPIIIPGRPRVELGNDTSLCTGNTIALDASGWTGSEYLWSDNSTGSVLLINQNNPGNYLFSVNVNYNGCTAKDSINILYKQTPQLELVKSNDINCLLGTATLRAEGALFYMWEPANSLTNPNSGKTTASPDASTNYRVIGIAQNGCRDTASLQLNVDLSGGASSLVVPSAFTPNNDGLNDCFGVSYWGRVTEFRLSVFDRWGQRIFFTTNPDNCWDGKFNNIPKETGTYVYELVGTGICGPVRKKGYVVLIR